MDLVDELIGQHEVGNGVCVGLHAEVLVVAPREAHVDAVVPVQHAGHAVKAEAVKSAEQIAAVKLYATVLWTCSARHTSIAAADMSRWPSCGHCDALRPHFPPQPRCCWEHKLCHGPLSGAQVSQHASGDLTASDKQLPQPYHCESEPCRHTLGTHSNNKPSTPGNEGAGGRTCTRPATSAGWTAGSAAPRGWRS